MLMEDIEVKVYRSRIKIPVIFFVPATFLVTVYVVAYLLVNSQLFLDEGLERLSAELPGSFGVTELVVDPSFTEVHLWDVTIDGGVDHRRVVEAEEVHAGINPLPLLVRRIQVDYGLIRGGSFDMRIEGPESAINLLHALGLHDRPESESDEEPLISSVSLRNLECRGCSYTYWQDIFEFQVPDVDIPHGEIDIADGILLMRVPAVDIARGDFEFRHWLYYFPEEAGNWEFTVNDTRIRNWAWAGDGFSVETIRTEIGGMQIAATGTMTFPPAPEGEPARMEYRARGKISIPPWTQTGQYFVDHFFHVDARTLEIGVEGTLDGIRGAAEFDVGVLDAYGLQVTDIAGTAILDDEIVAIDRASGTMHGGDVDVTNAYYDMFEGRFGGDIEFDGVDPAGVVSDFGFDYPWLQGRATGSMAVLGKIEYAEEYDKETTPWVMLNQFLDPMVEIRLPTETQFVRTGAMDTLPGRRFRIRPGAHIWTTPDRVGIEDTTIVADNARFDIDGFVFDWERYELLRDQWDRIAELRIESSNLAGLVGDYGGSGIDGSLVAELDAVGRLNYPDVDFDVRIDRPKLSASGFEVDGEQIAAVGRLSDGRLQLRRAEVESESGSARLKGWVDILRDPRGLKDDEGELITDYLSPRRHPAEIEASVERLDLSKAVKLAGFDVPVTGRASGSFELRGPLENPDATFSARAKNTYVMGQKLDRASVSGAIADRTYRVDEAVIDAGPAGYVEGRAKLGFDDSYSFEVTGTRMNLARIEPIRERDLEIAGDADFEFHGEGTLDEPFIGGDARVEGLAVSGRSLGDLALVANTLGDTTYLVGALLPWITVDIELPLDGESSYYARFGVDHLNVIDAVPELRDTRVVTAAETTGTVEVFLEPDFSRYQVLANLSDLNVQALGKTFRNRGPVIAGLNNGELFQIQQATIGTRDRFVSLQGGIFLDETLIDLSLKGDLDLSLLTGFRLSFPEFFPESFLESRGEARVDATVKGTPGLIVADGFVDFEPSEVLLRDVADPLSILSGRVEFDRDSIVIERDSPLRGRVLGGVFNATGSVGLRGMTPHDLQANVWTHNMSYRITDVANFTFDTQLALSAPDLDRPETWTVSGEVDLLDGLYYENISVFQEQLTNRLIGAFSRQTERYEASIVERFPSLEEMNFDLALRARDGFRIQNEIDRLELDMELRIDLRLQNTLPDPRVTGDIDVIDGGVTFQGEAFEVRDGVLSFYGNPDNPEISLVADADIFNTCRDTDVTADVSQTMSLSGVVDTGEQKTYHVILNVRGRLDNLDIQFESNPYADQRDILSLLLTGCTVDQLTASSASSPTLEVALGPVLGWIEGQVQDVVEVEEFTITPSVDRLKATVGDSISRRMSWRLQLDTGLTEVATGQRFQLEYRLSDRWSARASESSTESSQFDSFLVDFKLRYRIFLD
jgi:hypothetical protein